MTRYQGRALAGARRRGPGLGRRLLLVLGAMGLVGLVSVLPWGELRARFMVLQRVEVRGVRYLEPGAVRARSGLAAGQDLLDLDLDAARDRVLAETRVKECRIRRTWLRGVRIEVQERLPVLVVSHGEPWELDAEGVLLAPLQEGAVADVPVLAGVDLERVRPGVRSDSPRVQRGLAWATVLSDNALGLGGQVSEVDVSSDRVTRLVLLNGVRVVGPLLPNGARQLSGLRATLLDLANKGMTPREIDVRFKDQVVVRGADKTSAVTAETSRGN